MYKTAPKVQKLNRRQSFITYRVYGMFEHCVIINWAICKKKI